MNLYGDVVVRLFSTNVRMTDFLPSLCPTKVSISQWPHSILSEAISGRSSMLAPRMHLFLRALCALLFLVKASGISNGVKGRFPAHNSLYSVFVQGISSAANSQCFLA